MLIVGNATRLFGEMGTANLVEKESPSGSVVTIGNGDAAPGRNFGSRLFAALSSSSSMESAVSVLVPVWMDIFVPKVDQTNQPITRIATTSTACSMCLSHKLVPLLFIPPKSNL
jgi:hypothetical protein